MSSYFNLVSFARAKKNKDELEKSNPQNPVLKDEDEKFLERSISQERAAQTTDNVPATKITDDGQEKPASEQEQKAAGEDQVIVPENQPESSTVTQDKRHDKRKDMELPSQEDAEAATRSWQDKVKVDDQTNATANEKRTWASYLPTSLQPTEKKDPSPTDASPQDNKKTWTQYATSYVPNAWLPPSFKDADSQPDVVYNPDGTINESATKEKQEKEISVLLDNLNMSTLNNRVFALSEPTHQIYERFAQVLKDTINGGPTAYEDMEKLMREAGPQLEKQFQSMPPFVQTLVKSLPAKMGATLAPELLAAASEKPGADLKAAQEGGKEKKKKKRTIPGLKSLISKEGAVATILRNTVTFLQTRFPFLAATTNVVMSLAVFILMFVFWYCHKRGKEVRLAKAAEADKDGTTEYGDDDDDEIEDDVSDDAEEESKRDMSKTLNQADPKDVPLPQENKDQNPTKTL